MDRKYRKDKIMEWKRNKNKNKINIKKIVQGLMIQHDEITRGERLKLKVDDYGDPAEQGCSMCVSNVVCK